MAGTEREIAQLIKEYCCQTEHGLTIGTVESATGGEIAKTLTEVPGSSDYYKGSVIAYSNEIKTNLTGVKKETLRNFGAVSHETVIEMAQGGRKLLGVDICVADTGLAGPAGDAAGKPVGTFYLGLAGREGATSRRYVFRGNRETNRKDATEATLQMLKRHLQQLLKQCEKDAENKKIS